MSEPAIRTVKLTKVYGKKVKTHALRGVSIEIPKGSLACIVGASGHGKSTLLQMIGGLDAPTSGQVFVGGVDIGSLPDNKLSELRGQKIGFVFQSFNLLENLTALENIQTAMMFAKPQLASSRSRAPELLDVVGLADKAAAKPSELSGGQMQRVTIARALANSPEILLMDEPTGNLDSKSAENVMDLVMRIHAQGKTIVIVTHSGDIARQAQLVIRIHDGQVVSDL